MPAKLETGGNLLELAQFAKNWFKVNDVEMPQTAREWTDSSVRRKELPPECTAATLKKQGISALNFIKLILGEDITSRFTHNPITKSNCLERTGLLWLSYTTVSKHKRIKTKCSVCEIEEVLDYGTLQRMIKANNKLCRHCRNAGGKAKILSVYDNIEGFTPVSVANRKIDMLCNTCDNTIRRALSYVKNAEYLVCEYCNPHTHLGVKIETKHGAFDSVVESLAYEKLLEYFDKEEVQCQVSYNELFNTGTKHTADFYIPKLDLVLEITTKKGVHMKLGHTYRTTHDWKLKVSDKVKFAYSIKQVEDIVRAALTERFASHCRNVYSCSTIWRFKATRSI